MTEKERVLESFPVRVVRCYAAANGSTYAINIAWNILFAFFPIILAITIILGLVAGGSGISQSIDRDIAGAFPGQQGTVLVQALHSFRESAGLLAIVSFVGLLWSGSSLFGAMDQGLAALNPARRRGFVLQKLMGVAMILVFTVLVVLDVASASLIPLIGKLPNTSILSSGPVAVVLQIVVGVLDGLLLFGAIYLLVPNRRLTVREILPGAFAAALLLEAFTWLFPLYFKLAHGFNTYGSTFALFFLLLTFAFWIGQIVMLGGAVNAERHPPQTGAGFEAGRSTAPEAETGEDVRRRRAAGAPGGRALPSPRDEREREIVGAGIRRRGHDEADREDRRTVRGDGWDPARAHPPTQTGGFDR